MTAENDPNDWPAGQASIRPALITPAWLSGVIFSKRRRMLTKDKGLLQMRMRAVELKSLRKELLRMFTSTGKQLMGSAPHMSVYR